MDLGLRGRRALVTGSTAGIGFATAQALASEGAAVMVNGRTEAWVATAVRAIRGAVSGAHLGGVAADLGTAEGCEILTQEVPWADVLFVQRLAQSRGIDSQTMEREFFASARPSSLLRRFARPEEVAAMIAYICSARASATNGAALRVDGGVVRAVV